MTGLDITQDEFSIMPNKVKFVLIFEGTGCSEATPSSMTRIWDKIKETRTQRKHLVAGSGTRFGLLVRLYNSITGADSFEILLEQYKWLSQHVVELNLDSKGIELYLFGFSRGGYQAIMFIELVSRYGIPSSALKCVEYVHEYKRRLKRFSEIIAPEINESYVAMIKYVGLIDPVRAMIPGWLYWNCSAIPRTIAGRCALSIHEVRRAFSPKVTDVLGSIESVWFGGVHSDIGFAYNGKRGTKTLGTIAMEWLLSPTYKNLEFISYANKIPKSFADMALLALCYNFLRHNSLVKGWRLLFKKKRKIARRHVTVRAMESAYRRIGIEPPAPFSIWPLPSRWFPRTNKRRLIKAMKALMANRAIVDSTFRLFKLY